MSAQSLPAWIAWTGANEVINLLMLDARFCFLSDLRTVDVGLLFAE